MKISCECRNNTKSNVEQRSRSKRKGKATRSLITGTLKKELECRKNANDKIDAKEINFDNTNSSKAKANLVSNVVIELFDVDKLLCHTLPSNDASTLHVAKF